MFLPIGKKKKGKEPVQQQGCASPLEDGWFFSDYFMFYHLFHGLGRWKKILCYVSGNWLSLIFEQEPTNAGSCVNLLEIWSKNTELMVTAKGKRKLNISALTAAGPDVQSWSWPSNIGGAVSWISLCNSGTWSIHQDGGWERNPISSSPKRTRTSWRTAVQLTCRTYESNPFHVAKWCWPRGRSPWNTILCQRRHVGTRMEATLWVSIIHVQVSMGRIASHAHSGYFESSAR